jgi:GNAT superfamily N-acetyltransferase
VPRSLRALVTGATLVPTRPRLILGEGGRDGERIPLRAALDALLGTGSTGVQPAGGSNIYADNAAALWASLASAAEDSADLCRAELATTVRVILRRPVPLAALLAAPAGKIVTVEDPSGTVPAPDDPAVEVRRMPVMNRPAGPIAVTAPPGVRVVRVGDPDELAEAERVMVDGFPLRTHQPWTRGTAVPPRVLDLPGWDVWLAYHSGQPAAAAVTYDDGRAAGVYWLATLPEHRGAGLGRAVLTRGIAHRPGRIFTLVATGAGRPLYDSTGFRTVSTATWFRRAGTQ